MESPTDIRNRIEQERATASRRAFELIESLRNLLDSVQDDLNRGSPCHISGVLRTLASDLHTWVARIDAYETAAGIAAT